MMILMYGERIKKLREKHDKTQEDVANAIGIKRSSFNQFEQQYDIIPIKRLNQIANYFDVSLDYLFCLTEINNYSNNKHEINIDISSERLKEFRKENNLTQNKLADKLNISRSIIVYHENKRTIM